MIDGLAGLLRDVDLAGLQPLEQLVGRQVHELDLVGSLEDRIRHRLANAHVGDLGDDVVQALDVLDVERGVDVDAALEQFQDVLPPLLVAAAWRVGVRQLVERGAPSGRRASARSRSNSAEGGPAVGDLTARQDLEPLEQRRRLRTSVRLDAADHHVDALRLQAQGGLQHREGLADPGRVAEEDLQGGP